MCTMRPIMKKVFFQVKFRSEHGSLQPRSIWLWKSILLRKHFICYSCDAHLFQKYKQFHTFMPDFSAKKELESLFKPTKEQEHAQYDREAQSYIKIENKETMLLEEHIDSKKLDHINSFYRPFNASNLDLPKFKNIIENTSKDSECINKENITASHNVKLINIDESSNKVTKPITEGIVNDTSKLGSEELPSKVKRYFFGRYTVYLKRFQESLENEMPDTFNMFRIFSIGLKDFMVDFKDYIKILIQLSLPGKSLKTLSYHELVLYHAMPWNMMKVSPILIISAIPFGQNIAFPIGYWFPQHLLCHHFWDIQQRHNFAVIALKKRLFIAKPVFRSVQAVLYNIKDKILLEKCKSVIFKLGSGIHPTSEEILQLLPLFKDDPFHLNSIFSKHVAYLLKLHGLSAIPLNRRNRLKDHARLIHSMDAAILNEGLQVLSFEQLKWSLFLRGINPTNMSTEKMMEFLNCWMSVSCKIDDSTLSLLLHLPIFLGYNQPTNILLISK